VEAAQQAANPYNLDPALFDLAEQLILRGDRAYFGRGVPLSHDAAFKLYQVCTNTAQILSFA
jgi:hypothetical protein